MAYGSLEEALLLGWELERQYVCQAHPDHSASACVNATTGFFICYACGHRGKVDKGTLHMTPAGLQSFLHRLHTRMNPDHDRYSESWLNAFDSNGPGQYWGSRFNEETCRFFRLGTAPGVATYPMRNNIGEVLGVVTRDLTGEREMRYKYPSGLQVGQYLIDCHRVETDTVILAEGMSDVAAAYETGFHATLGCYKAGLTNKQAELLRKYAPDRILVAFDMDEAGEKGFQRVSETLGRLFRVERLVWSDYNDLAAIPLLERTAMLEHVLGESVSKTQDHLTRVTSAA